MGREARLHRMHATQNHDRLAFENSDAVLYLQQCACRDVVFCGIQLSNYSSLEHSGNENTAA